MEWGWKMESILLHLNIVGFSSESLNLLIQSKTDTKVSAHQAKLFFNCSWGLFVFSYSGLLTTRTRNVFRPSLTVRVTIPRLWHQATYVRLVYESRCNRTNVLCFAPKYILHLCIVFHRNTSSSMKLWAFFKPK